MRAPPQVPEFPCLDELGPCANSEPTIAIGGLTCLGRPGLGHMICHVGERDWGGRVSLSCMRAESCLTLRPCGLWPTRLLCLWDFPGKNTGVGCRFLLQGTFPTQGPNSCLLHWQADPLPLTHQRSQTQILSQ